MPFCFLNFRNSNPENVYFSNFHLPSYKPDQKGKFIKRKTRTIYQVPTLRISPIKTLELSHSMCLWLQNRCSIFFKWRIHLVQSSDFPLYTKMIISIIAQTNLVDPWFTSPPISIFILLNLLTTFSYNVNDVSVKKNLLVKMHVIWVLILTFPLSSKSSGSLVFSSVNTAISTIPKSILTFYKYFYNQYYNKYFKKYVISYLILTTFREHLLSPTFCQGRNRFTRKWFVQGHMTAKEEKELSGELPISP